MNSQHKFHNRHNLTPEQVGDGYRLLLEGEIMNRPNSKDIHCWDAHQNKWDTTGWCGYGGGQTYRVPLATWPLPEEPEWILGNSVNGFTLGEGQQWHRLDWIREMLPDGWRPLLMGESVQAGDEAWQQSENAEEGYWSLWEVSSIFAPVTHHRTRRPLPAPATVEPELTYHQWRGDDRGCAVAPTSNDAWESLLRTNANLGREVSELRQKVSNLSLQLGGVVTACHLEGYNVGEPLGEWLTKQFADAKANLAELLKARAALRVIRGALP